MLEGDLGDFSIAEILQLLGFTKKTGWLQLHGPRSVGRMVLAEGGLMDVTADVARVGVVRRLLGLGYVSPDPIVGILEAADELPTDRQLLAQLVERGHLDAEVSAQICHNHALESLGELLRWTEGSFRFQADPAAAASLDDGEVLPAETMMAEANERLSGWDELEERIGAGDQVVSLTSPMPPRDVTIPAAAWGLLMFVDGQRTVDELALLSGRGAYDTRVALAELIDQNLVALGDDVKLGEAGLAEAIARVARIESAHHPGAAVDTAPGTASPGEARGSETDEQDHAVDAREEAASSATDDPAPTSQPEPAGFAGEDLGQDEHTDGPEEQAAPASGLSAVVNEEAASAESPRNLRMKVRGERLRTDPSIDEDLVSRLIDGVEGM